VKLKELGLIANYLQKYQFIKRVRRVDDNIIECDFFDEKIYFFMLKQNGFIFKNDNIAVSKFYKAPFDTMLAKYFTKAKIASIQASPTDRILFIKVETSSSYKTNFFTLRFEFMGRNTNAIIVDEKNVIVEALRHVDGFSSFRIIQPGKKLLLIPPKKIEKKI